MLYETYKHTNTRAQHVDPRDVWPVSLFHTFTWAHIVPFCRHFEALAHQSVFISIGKADAERTQHSETRN